LRSDGKQPVCIDTLMKWVITEYGLLISAPCLICHQDSGPKDFRGMQLSIKDQNDSSQYSNSCGQSEGGSQEFQQGTKVGMGTIKTGD